LGGDTVDDIVSKFEREEAKELRAQGKRPPRAKRAAVAPEELAYLLIWYDSIRSGMPRGMEVEPISHCEIKAFRDLHSLDMDSFDVQMLRRLDGEWFKCLPKRENTPPAPKPA